ncbi:MAG: hypothetical protein GXP62_14870 [Oligoflexia bacterium]|nr:hypothetical protein [Oligoflexia bacterium]
MPTTIPSSAALPAAAPLRGGWPPAGDRGGSLRYPRVGLSALSPRALLLTLFAALCLLLASVPARAAGLRLSVDGDPGRGVSLAAIRGTVIVRTPSAVSFSWRGAGSLLSH